MAVAEETLEEFARRCIRASVKDATATQYDAFVRRVRAATGKIDYHGVLTFIQQNQHLKAQSLRCHISAVRFFCRTEGLRLLSDRQWERIKHVVDGIEADQPEDIKRGLATREHLAQVTKLARNKGLDMYAEGLELQMAATLRPHDVRDLCFGDVCPEGESVTVSAKVWKKRRGKRRRVSHDVHDPVVAAMLRRRFAEAPDARPDARVFPEWKARKINGVVHEAAASAGWDPDLKWDGTHIFRHGSTRERFEKEIAKAKLRRDVNWTSENGPDPYIQSVRERKSPAVVAARQAARENGEVLPAKRARKK